MSENVILTTGIYDLIKDHVRRKKVTQQEEALLLMELKEAQQVLRRDLPENVVTVNRRVKIKDHTKNKEKEYLFVATTKTNNKKGKLSILCDVAVATVGRQVGDIINWPFRDGERKLEILGVENI
ncbi:MAG: transcription elongation factor GreAB [Aequorivita sp.]|jgi:regulator of nucleoside diphosphate kinase|nr:transcription elongation factor GreAB [Aequorivita sp.]MBP42247.1 transcription elongation factor GreAB [Aequorivita sp.]HBC03231.1 transcription elongation factor GreAB [Aequorivita sp.]|tara:strand:- start:5666 stop:6040 length:375 start_codon:yes stop_codon:yes gene_type:complete